MHEKERNCMFESLNNLLNGLFGELRTLGISIFAIGLIVMALLTAFGGEENKRSFQKGFVVCIVGLIVFFGAKPLITWVQTFF